MLQVYIYIYSNFSVHRGIVPFMHTFWGMSYTRGGTFSVRLQVTAILGPKITDEQKLAPTLSLSQSPTWSR